MEQKQEGNKQNKNKGIKVTFRMLQAVCFGIFALGISTAFGDYTSFIKIPISSFSISATTFGAIGALIMGVLAKVCQDW